MENQRNQGRNTGRPQSQPGQKAPAGFEGMNFEEQRGPLKNSDGAGVSYDHNESMKQRNGQSGPKRPNK
ncbi:hypothetical protein EPD60_04560 [Flaviaesturariibacter flavus]|uniref:Uncharacterized protein n=1 Tax=Flaviaesturariibacter flavus TaxID=2502780 RepID=A0A4R1BJN5_9BACT|nr:hypothetical protein [Flaviaesturariibacter flavus]TCJ17467.1 hypothetical protein EPD60_04560 [Flaviaesturariibacter flavus]